MNNKEQFAKMAVKAIGGRENFIHVFYCTNSIRVNYKHVKNVNETELKQIPGISGFVNKGHQIQLILGKDVEDAFNAFIKEANWDPDNEPVNMEEPEKDEEQVHNAKYYAQKFGNFVAPIFFPIIPALVVGGLILYI